MNKKSWGLILILIIINISSIYSLQQNSSETQNKIYLRLDFNNNDLVNGKEFNIEVSAFNLKSKDYDLKLYIYNDDKSDSISQTRDQDFKWISSDRYIKNFFSGPGDPNDKIKLRINENYKNFSGSATLIARIRETGTTGYIEEQEDMFILKNKIIYSQTNNIEQMSVVDESDYQETPLNAEVIRIGVENRETESIKTQNNIIYESKNELIKRYSIYGFIILIIIFLVLLALKII